MTEHRLLLIDDQPINAELMQAMLADETGFVVEYLQDPLQAVPVAEAFGPTVMLVDLRMPPVDGLDVIRALKERARLAEVPVVMLSSNDNPHAKAEGFAAGAMDYLVKWPDRIELAARLRAHSRACLTALERDSARHSLDASQAELLARTRELAEAEAALHEVQKMEAIGQLTSGVAHDFNNVLQLINGHLQLLRLAHRSDERTTRRLDAASEGVRRGAQLADRLLAFARRQPLRPVIVDAAALLRGMEGRLRQALGARSLTISAAADAPLVALDQAGFEQSILHLVQNAADAMAPDGHLVIEVGAERAPAGEATGGSDQLRIRVADDGAGMSADVQRRAFEPFFSTKAGGRRGGVGLSLAFAFVKQSGGQIALASTPDAGTTVSLHFPAQPAARARTVLVVEDEPSVRAASAEVLRQQGLCTFEAADGETALALIRQRLPIDLLFTDIAMPGATDGYELALAAAEHLPHARVLFASGCASDLDRAGEGFRQAPLLRKPYRLDEMTRTVQRLLAQARS
ncbi:response regulator [Massilia sp.]|uniref:response regulator n=1 Tax=Massilia sp. TaxID=1882437 RepID=UPI0028ACE99A|nr:response regulator [Massilia sp.]